MNDGLSRLLPDDPQNLLSVEARKRIQRAIIQADRFIWEAEVAIQQRALNTNGERAYSLRRDANFKKANAVLTAHHREFSRLNITEAQFREIMRDEVESASNSLGLSDFQRRLLENAFYFPEEKPALPPLPEAKSIAPSIVLEQPETVASQLEALRRECQLTADDLAQQTEIDIRSVRRHLKGHSIPYDRNLWAYQRAFSKLLNKKIVISKMSKDVRKRP